MPPTIWFEILWQCQLYLVPPLFLCQQQQHQPHLEQHVLAQVKMIGKLFQPRSQNESWQASLQLQEINVYER
ncbi:Protein of unknown function [Gryllus bimaculatus]|nr:Protein of unknown function [Gryllus bimaculatus]